MEATQIKTIVTAGILVVLFVLEDLIPFYLARKGHIRHWALNLVFALVNLTITKVIFVGLMFEVSGSYFANTYGLLNYFELTGITRLVCAILIFDAWMYSWHVLNHLHPFFWSFHKVHHSDPEVDTSSAFRFHPIEIILSNIFRLGVIAVLGLRLGDLLAYETVLLPVIMFHHSNVKISERFDRLYRIFIASPHMHRIHHSDIVHETNSNYGSIFSFWDRIFRTFRTRPDPENIIEGLKQYSPEEASSLRALLMHPWDRR